MNTYTQYFWLGFFIFHMTGCATLSKEECVRGEWSVVGYQDGANGYPANRFAEHISACREHGITPRQDLYAKGRAQGLQHYCTAEIGFKEGSAIRHYQGVCPRTIQARFLRGYVRGLTQADQENQRQLQLQRDNLIYKQGQLSYAREEKERKQLRSDIESLNSEIQRFSNKASEIKNLINQAHSFE